MTEYNDFKQKQMKYITIYIKLNKKQKINNDFNKPNSNQF
jgi:hypothetical protein